MLQLQPFQDSLSQLTHQRVKVLELKIILTYVILVPSVPSLFPIVYLVPRFPTRGVITMGPLH